MSAARNFRQFHTTFVAKPFKFMTKEGCFFCVFPSTLGSVACETGQEFKDNGSSRNLENRNDHNSRCPGVWPMKCCLPHPPVNPCAALMKVLFPGISHQRSYSPSALLQLLFVPFNFLLPLTQKTL